MKKRLLLVAAGLVCVLIAGYFVHAWLTKTRINRETFERIRVGMTLQEVEDLLGVPPGYYETRHRHFDGVIWHELAWYIMREERRSLTWSSNDGEIVIFYSNDGRVTHKRFHDVELESLEDTIWRWLGFPREPEADVLIEYSWRVRR